MDTYTRSDLAGSGIGRRKLDREVQSGSLSKLRRGAYALAGECSARERHRDLVFATAPMLASHSVISHLSAAVLHGLPVPDSALSIVTATRERSKPGGGNLSRYLHTYCVPLSEDDVVTIGGLRVTSLARTAADAARLLPRDDAVVLLDAALHSPAGGEDAALREQITEHMHLHRRRRGGSEALKALRWADGTSESPIETISRLAFVRHGLPKPVLQLQVVDVNGVLVARCDFAWPEHGVLGEVDGRVKYDALLRAGENAADVVMREKRRENALQTLGWVVVRWTWDDLRNPAELCRRIGRLLARHQLAS